MHRPSIPPFNVLAAGWCRIANAFRCPADPAFGHGEGDEQWARQGTHQPHATKGTSQHIAHQTGKVHPSPLGHRLGWAGLVKSSGYVDRAPLGIGENSFVCYSHTEA